MVSTFLEDSLRMWFQWDRQVKYLERNGLVGGLAQFFLMFNIILQVGCSLLAIIRLRRVPASYLTIPAVLGLTLVLLSQMVAYRLFFDPQFLVVFLSLIGGFLILITGALEDQEKARKAKVSEPLRAFSDTLERSTTYMLLLGRILLLGLYFNFAFDFKGDMGTFRLVTAFLGLGLCLFIVVGFRAKESAAILLVFLLALNVVTKNWWENNSSRNDFVKYEFFQVISVAGGYLLLSFMGPGKISIDKKKE